MFGDKSIILKEMIKEIEEWTDDEFDQEDFEVIGYCKNI